MPSRGEVGGAGTVFPTWLGQVFDDAVGEFPPAVAVGLAETRALANAGEWPEALATIREIQVADNCSDPLPYALIKGILAAVHEGLADYIGAVAHSHECSDIFRVMTATDPKWAPVLAASLQAHSVTLARAGRHDDALEVFAEAAEILGDLDADDTECLVALTTHALLLSDVMYEHGRANMVIMLIGPTIPALRNLAADDPSWGEELGSALINLGRCIEPPDEVALSHVCEGAQLISNLADKSPWLKPKLSAALNSASIQLAASGHNLDALAVAQEAVELERELERCDTRRRSDLARALYTLALRQSAVEHHERSIQSASEAVELYRGCWHQDPSFAERFARALTGLANRLAEVEQFEDALQATLEATDLYRRLSDDDVRFQPDLIRSLERLKERLKAVGRGAAAIAVTGELGVARLRHAATRDP